MKMHNRLSLVLGLCTAVAACDAQDPAQMDAASPPTTPRIGTPGSRVGGVEVPPTGLAFEQDWAALLTFDGDRIAAIDEFYDNYGTLIQLGLAQ